MDQGYQCNVIVGQDNQSTITMVSETKKESMRTKHINVRYFWIRERIKLGELNLVYVPTGNMLADVLIKPMQGNLFRSFVRRVCCRDDLLTKRSDQIKGVRL